MSEKETKARFGEIVAFEGEIGDFIDQEVKHYSSGMFMRLAFSVAIHVNLDVLLVDEDCSRWETRRSARSAQTSSRRWPTPASR